MGEESRQLKEHIDNTRDELGRNIVELRAKVRRTVDWRAQFQERPLAMVGIAFGAGLALAIATR